MIVLGVVPYYMQYYDSFNSCLLRTVHTIHGSTRPEVLEYTAKLRTVATTVALLRS
jgi:hypothetical protein